jgi:hypothetical protein
MGDAEEANGASLVVAEEHAKVTISGMTARTNLTGVRASIAHRPLVAVPNRVNDVSVSTDASTVKRSSLPFASLALVTEAWF